MLKKYFVTGVVLLLPLAMTIAIVVFIVNFFTDPFVGMVRGVFERYGLFQTGLLFLSANQIQLYISKLLVLLLLFFFTVLLGMLTRWFIIHNLIRLGDFIFHRIPFVSSIYKTSQDMIRTIFGTDATSFKQVVLVPFPKPETYSLGFVTREDIPSIHSDGKNLLTSVFVPTTPNPTSGFLMMYHSEELIYLDMSVEEAFKYVISGGVIHAPFVKSAKVQTVQIIGEEKS